MTQFKRPTFRTKNVTPGAQGATIRADRYERIRAEILDILQDPRESHTLKELGDTLRERLSDVSFAAKGSVTWYLMAVKLDLEARGLIERIQGSRPQRVRRAS